MKLEKITEERCRDCGALPVIEKRSVKAHSNGPHRENRIFDCGRHLSYIPNFDRVLVEKPCQQNAQVQAQEEARGKLAASLAQAVSSNTEISLDTKRELLSSLYWHCDARERLRIDSEIDQIRKEIEKGRWQNEPG